MMARLEIRSEPCEWLVIKMLDIGRSERDGQVPWLKESVVLKECD